MNAEAISENQDQEVEAMFLFEDRPVVIGRSLDADILVPDPWASRRNTEIVPIDGKLVVRDLGSKNGTLVNGQHISEKPLIPGDRLTVGLSSFLVSADGHALERCGMQPPTCRKPR